MFKMLVNNHGAHILREIDKWRVEHGLTPRGGNRCGQWRGIRRTGTCSKLSSSQFTYGREKSEKVPKWDSNLSCYPRKESVWSFTVPTANLESCNQPISFSAVYPEGPRQWASTSGQIDDLSSWGLAPPDASSEALLTVVLGYWSFFGFSVCLPRTLSWASGGRHAGKESFLPLKTSILWWVSLQIWVWHKNSIVF